MPSEFWIFFFKEKQMMNKWWLGVLCGSLLAGPVLAEAPDTDKEAIRAMLGKHDAALNAHDVEGLLKLYADGEGIAVMGTAPGEFWQGRAAVKELYQHLSDFEKGSLKHECAPAFSGIAGDTAWAATSCKMTDTVQGKPREYGLNVSIVLSKQGQEWRLRSMHYSNLAGGSNPPPAK
jgi:uncharacterized protein (TIGR02246 family)